MVTEKTATSITITWDAPSSLGFGGNPYYYRGIKESASISWGASVGSPTQGLFTQTFTGLTEGTSYDIRVWSCRFNINSGCGSTVVLSNIVAEAPPISPPDAVTDLSVSLSGNDAALTWTIPDDGGAAISSYRIEHDLSGDGSWAEAHTNTINANVAISRTVTNSGYTSLTRFRIRHSNSEGDGGWSNVAMAGPGAPVLINEGAQGDTKDELRWTAPSDGGSAITKYQYRVRESADPAPAWGSWTDPPTDSPTALTRVVDKPDNGQFKAFQWQVRAVNSAGEGPASNAVTIAGRPSGLGTLTASGVANQVAVELSWSAPSNDGGKEISQYLVQWRKDADGNWSQNGPEGSRYVTSGTSVTITAGARGVGLEPGTTYNFRYRADNEDRASFFNVADGSVEAATAMVQIDPPSAPLSLAATAGEQVSGLDDTQVRLAWGTPPSDGNSAITDYLIQWRQAGETAWQGPSVLMLEASTPLQHDVTGLDAQLAHDFRVAAVNSATVLADAVWADVTLVGRPAAPSGFTAASSSVGAAVNLDWAAAAASEVRTGYRVEWRDGSHSGAFTDSQVLGHKILPPHLTGVTLTTSDGLVGGRDYDFRLRAFNTVRTGEFAGNDGTVTATVNASARVSSTSPAVIAEQTLHGATVTVDLQGTQWASSLSAGHFSLSAPGTSGLSVASVNRQSGTRAVLRLAFSGDVTAALLLGIRIDGSATVAGIELNTGLTYTINPAPTPGRVSGVRATAGPGSLDVTWRTVSNADGYVVQWKRSSSSGYASADRLVVRGGSTSRATIDGLLGDTRYDVRVHATSRHGGNGQVSTATSATTEPTHAAVTSTDPSPLSERNLDGAVLTVDLLEGLYDPWAPRLDRARVTVSGVPGVTVAGVRRVSDRRMLVTLASDDTDFDVDATLRVEFYLAHTSIETVTAVAPVAAVVEPPPGRVQNVQVTPGDLSMRVTWDPVEGATGYRVEWSPAAAYGSSYHKNWPWPTRYTIGALRPDTTYTVRVVATKTRAPDGPRSASASARTPAFGARLVRTDPAPLTEDNLHRARLTVDLTGVEWTRLVEGRYYRSQLGWLNDCSQAKYYDNCYPFIVTRSVAVTGIERVSGSRAIVSLWARNVNLDGNGLWIRFPDDLHTHYHGEADYIILQLIAPDQPEQDQTDPDDFEIAQNQRPEPGSVTVSTTGLAVDEGSEATYQVSLQIEPTDDVEITIGSDNSDVTAQPASLTFTRDDWQTARTVTVRAAHDHNAADDTATLAHTVSGADNYAGIEVDSVTVSVADDDTAAVTITPTILSVGEGSSADYQVSLSTQPISNVLISVFAHGVTAQPTQLTFTPDNWQTAQTVTVHAGHDDDTVDGTAAVSHGIGAAPGSPYSGVALAFVTVAIIDDDEPAAQAAQQHQQQQDDGDQQQGQLQQQGQQQEQDGGGETGGGSTEQTQPDGEPQAQAAQQSEPASDREILVAFYEATGGDGWTDNANWLSDKPLRHWHGVTTNAQGQVTHLALRDNNLNGTLPAAIGGLDALEVLSLDRNSIGGSLPAELGNLSNLTRLAMNRNQLTGPIPSELGSLSNLSIIGLARNQLTGTLPASLGNLGNLAKLSLHDNTALSGTLPAGFGTLTSLTRLAVSRTALSGTLPQGLTANQMRYLHYDDTSLCAPDNSAFQTWLDTITSHNGPTCE